MKCKVERVCVFFDVWCVSVFFDFLVLIRSVYVFDFLLLKRMEHHGLEWAGHESRKTLWMVCVLTFFC